MGDRVLLVLISLILAISRGGAAAQGVSDKAAQEVGANKLTGAKEVGGKKEAKAREVIGKKADAGAQSQSSGATQPSAAHPDFKVLVWYSRNDPLGTFKYQIYDLRKGEYTAAVDAWVRKIEITYPVYSVVVRGVDLKRERGETEKLKVGSVIKRELIVAAAMAGVFPDGGASLSSGPVLGLSLTPSPAASMGSLNRPLGAAGIDRSYLNPPATPFPVPIPYPRPHP